MAGFLAEKGTRHFILISRGALPSRKIWDSIKDELAQAISRIRTPESWDATIKVFSLDISAHDSAWYQLSSAQDRPSLPPILDIIHTAGILPASHGNHQRGNFLSFRSKAARFPRVARSLAAQEFGLLHALLLRPARRFHKSKLLC